MSEPRPAVAIRESGTPARAVHTRTGSRSRRAGRLCATIASILIWLVSATILPISATQGPAPSPTRSDPASTIDTIVGAPEYRSARWGIHAVALDTGEVVYSHDSDRLFLPGSNMKLYSTALALARLGPEYRWRTSVYARNKPDKHGRLGGDLVVYGRGDPTISANFDEEAPLRKLERLADRIAAAGVRRIEGDLVADESYFSGVRFGYGWEWNDLQWQYGAEVSALTILDNVLGLTVTPSRRAGQPCSVDVAPPVEMVRIINRTRTSPKDGISDLGIYRAEGSNVVEVWGRLPVGGEAFTANLAVHDPAMLVGNLLAAELDRRGVSLKGRVRSVDARHAERMEIDRAVEIAYVESEPLSDVVRITNRVSQNLYAELLLRTVGHIAGPREAESSESAGLAELRALLRDAGVDPDAMVLADGSGLSRRNLVTPRSTVALLAFMKRHAHGAAFVESLPAAAEGTLERRFVGSPAEGRVRAKTGTLEGVSALAGYLVTRSGRPLAFCIFVNNATQRSSSLRKAIDEIVVSLVDA